jgi:hypothetical protein
MKLLISIFGNLLCGNRSDGRDKRDADEQTDECDGFDQVAPLSS